MLYLCYKHLQNATAADGGVAVRELLSHLLKEIGVPPQSIEKTPTGRPFLPNAPYLDISFSHTSALGVCALLDKRKSEHVSGKNWQIGVDAEPLHTRAVRNPLAFSGRFFGEHEQELVAASPDPEKAMLEIFTRKEAYAKYCGEGLAQNLSKTDTMAPHFCKAKQVCFVRREIADHMLKLCLPISLANTPIVYLEQNS